MLTDSTDNRPYDQCSYNHGADRVGANGRRPARYHYCRESGVANIDCCSFQ